MDLAAAKPGDAIRYLDACYRYNGAIPAGYAVDVVRSQGTVLPHQHDCLEIVFVHSGSVLWSVGDWTGVLVPGDVILFDANVAHCSLPLQENYIRSTLYFGRDWAQLPLAAAGDKPILLGSLQTEAICRVFRDIIQLRALTERHDVAGSATDRHLFAKLIAALDSTNVSAAQTVPPLLRQALRYMLDRPDLNPLEVARNCYVSHGHLCALFRQHLGCSPKRLMLTIQMNHLGRILYYGHTPKVNALARNFGFSTRRGFELAVKRIMRAPLSDCQRTIDRRIAAWDAQKLRR